MSLYRVFLYQESIVLRSELVSWCESLAMILQKSQMLMAGLLDTAGYSIDNAALAFDSPYSYTACCLSKMS